MHASGTSREITVADRISDISLISTACSEKNTYLNRISGISMELRILQQVLQQQIQIMDLISVSIIHRKMDSTMIAGHSRQHWHQYIFRVRVGSQVSKAPQKASQITYLLIN